MAAATDDEQFLFDLEEQGWQALCTSGDAAAAFYERVLAREVTMVFPGFVATDRRQVIESMGGTPWSHFALEDKRVMQLGANVALLTYRSRSRRNHDPEYNALITSAYVREDGDWKLAFHQQTPV